jgi:hypothetical protein
MRLVEFIPLAPAVPVLLVLLRGMINLFVYDEFGFRFSKRRQQRIDEDYRALDELVQKLTPRVLALRRQQERRIAGAIYSFRENSDSGALELDKVTFFSGPSAQPISSTALPADCATLLHKLDGPEIRQAFAQFAKQRRSLKRADRIEVQADGVSLIKGGFWRVPSPALIIHIDGKNQTSGAAAHNRF